MGRIVLYRLVLLALLPFMVTHGGGFGRVRHNISKVSDPPAAPKYNTRAASDIMAGTAEPWPRVIYPQGARRYIWYCFTDRLTYDEAKCEMEQAISRWYHKFGYDRGIYESTLRIKEWKNKDQEIFRRDGNTEWNPRVPVDALELIYDHDFEGLLTTVGYEPPEPNQAGRRHCMKFGHMPSHTKVDKFTHESGHAIGMNHEFQRSDRDQYVQFNCHALIGYFDAVQEAVADNPTISRDVLINYLCDNYEGFAEEYDFIAWDFAQFEQNHDEPGPFDIDSVMMYGSATGADDLDECLHVNRIECPLLVYQLLNGVPDRSLPPDTLYRAYVPVGWGKSIRPEVL